MPSCRHQPTLWDTMDGVMNAYGDQGRGSLDELCSSYDGEVLLKGFS